MRWLSSICVLAAAWAAGALAAEAEPEMKSVPVRRRGIGYTMQPSDRNASYAHTPFPRPTSIPTCPLDGGTLGAIP